MYCKHCGSENPEEALFCKNCGKRLEEIICPSCGNAVEAEWEYCIYCGRRVKDGQPDCAVPAAREMQEEAAVPSAKAATAKKVLNYFAAAAVLSTAVFSLIFVFLIGISSTVVFMDGYGGTVTESHYLYYYFGSAYNDLDDFLWQFTEYSGFFATCLYTPLIMGTIISALTLLTVAIFSVLGITFSIRYLIGKGKDNGAKFALTAYALYVAGAVLLYALNNSEVIYESNKTIYSLNGATTAGIVLSTISAAGYIGCAIAARGRELLKAEMIVKLSLSFAVVVLVAVILVLASRPAYLIDSGEFGRGESVKIGIITLMITFGTMCTPITQFNKVDNTSAVYALLILAFLVLAVLIVIAANLLVKNIEGATRKENKKAPLVLNCVLVVLSVLYLAFGILGADQFIDAVTDLRDLGGSESFTIGYAAPIAVLVLSVISLAVNITGYCLAKYFGKKSAPADMQQSN